MSVAPKPDWWTEFYRKLNIKNTTNSKKGTIRWQKMKISFAYDSNEIFELYDKIDIVEIY